LGAQQQAQTQAVLDAQRQASQMAVDDPRQRLAMFGQGITGLTGATSTADEVEVVVSGDPGSATVLRLTFVGVTGA